MIIETCIVTHAATGHEHRYTVEGKTLYNVRSGASHTYQSGTKEDPITGVVTPVYDTCYVSYFQYKGTYTCQVTVNGVKCGATLSEPYYYPDEPHHSACGQ